jgi:fatty-acyl-CoA synthase
MALALVQLYRQDDELLAQLQTYQAVISTSALLHKSIARRFNDVFQVPLRSCYGVTEVGGSITLQTWDEALEGESVGQHRPEIRIHCDGTTAKPAEVFCRTPFMMLGYLVDGKITSYANAEGFFPTGDLGYLDEGALHIVGRANDLVKRSGEFVSLQLIENLALRNGNIQEAAVVAVPDEFWGSKIILFYVPVTGANIEGIAADLDASFRSELRSIEFPTKVIPVLELPKTSIGKTIKRELINRYTI